MVLSSNQKKLLNNTDQKLRRSRKEIKMVLEEDSNKCGKQEIADSDECTEVQKSKED